MLSKTSLQIVKALTELAKLPKGSSEGAVRIARRIHAPQNYLGKMLQSLSYEGLVISQKGFKGGFRLAKPPAEITLFEIVDSIENISQWEGCFLGQKRCSAKTACAVHSRWEKVRNGYIQFLKETTLEDLVR
ncbi:MAG: Rrf2 family transcriptional regulator [Deltaproteobacteria bacterium]|nr:Rrf2 family transcriptional regulator [Deltaproteobacteria bacterium]